MASHSLGLSTMRRTAFEKGGMSTELSTPGKYTLLAPRWRTHGGRGVEHVSLAAGPSQGRAPLHLKECNSPVAPMSDRFFPHAAHCTTRPVNPPSCVG